MGPMGTSDDVMIARGEAERTSTRLTLERLRRKESLTGGGPDGNELLTAVNGAILIVLLAVLGFTIPQLRQLIWLHLFLGLLLIGPVLLKMASTGYRFAHYYARDPEYRRKGPPEIALRLTAPIVVLSTIGVFVTGIWLLIVGPGNRNPMLMLHKVTFIVWIVFMSLHVLGHLPEVANALGIGGREAANRVEETPGTAGRGIALTGAIVGGLVLAVVLIPEFAAWTAHGVFLHHHHDG
jgi:hypothetical protein